MKVHSRCENLSDCIKLKGEYTLCGTEMNKEKCGWMGRMGTSKRPTFVHTGKQYGIRCDMCSKEDNCPYDNVPKYPCKDFWGELTYHSGRLRGDPLPTQVMNND